MKLLKVDKIRKSYFCVITFIFLLFQFIPFLYPLFEYKEVFANTAGISGAYTSEDSNLVVIYYNPAGLFSIPKYSFYFSKTNLYGISQLSNNVLCFSAEIKSLGKIGFLYNIFGFDLYKENFLTFAYANSFTDKVSLGIGVKSLSFEVKNYGGKSFTSIDFGVIARFSPKILLGFTVKDFNMPEIAKEERVYPTLIIAGKIRPLKDVNTYVDVIKPTNDDIFCRIGEEVKLNFGKDIVGFIRAGVETVTQYKPAKYSIGFGIGYIIGKTELVLDYSYIVHTVLGGQHLFGLYTSFGKKEEIFFEEPAKNKTKVSTREYKTTKKQLPSKPININTATVEELIQLPGIGLSTAQKIVEYRQQIGKFTSIEQLFDIPRIGAVTLQQIKPYITLDDTEESEIKESNIKKEEESLQEEKVENFEHSEIEEVEEVIKKELPQAEEVVAKQQTPQQVLPEQPVVEQKPAEEKYNINTISKQELKKLGFSSIDAKNIIRYRERFGKFKSVNELYKVPNINYKIVDKLKPILIAE